MKTVLCFGDSNTHGTRAITRPEARERFPREARWPSVAAAALGPGWELIAEGQPGRTTVHPDPVDGGHKAGIAALPVLLETHRPLDAVAIMLGTNDLKRRFATTPRDIALGVERLVEAVLTSAAGPSGQAPAVLVICPPPVRSTGIFAETFEGREDVAARLAAAMQEMASRRGVAFLDAGAVAEVDPTDGIHLSEAAHAALGRAAADSLQALLGQENTGGQTC